MSSRPDAAAASPDNPCLSCGACCAAFRVSFYWTEADDAPGGLVPVAVTERLNTHLRCLVGTNSNSPHCSMLDGGVPGGRCTIYEQRPSPCRELDAFTPAGEPDEKCVRARARYGLPALPPRC